MSKDYKEAEELKGNIRALINFYDKKLELLLDARSTGNADGLSARAKELLDIRIDIIKNFIKQLEDVKETKYSVLFA